jgi:hypothetical protein
MVHLAQTIHLSCTDNSIASKLTETRFHRTHVTEEIHRVGPNDFWAYDTFPVNRAPIFQMYRNEIPHDPRHLGFPSGTSNTISECIVHLGQCVHLCCTDSLKNRCTIPSGASRLAIYPNRPKRASTWASSIRSTIGCVNNNLCAHSTFDANRAPILHWH